MKLKPCPFCGAVLVATFAEQDGNKYYGSAICGQCSATVYATFRRSAEDAKENAASEWNKRAK